MSEGQLSQMLNTEYQAPLWMKVMFGSMYFLQGMFLALPVTMILVYEELPQAWIISLLVGCKFPFSLKFLSAAMVEKYTRIGYGRRKTWIVFGQVCAGSAIFVASFLTSAQQQFPLACTFAVSILFISLQGIALGAAANKQFRQPSIPALLQGTMQSLGFIITSILFLETVSVKFAQTIGLQTAITSPQTFLLIITCISLLITTLVHVYYKQQTMQIEKQVKQKSMRQIIRYYGYFFRCSTRYFRSFCMFLIYMQGFILFEAYYEYELIEHHGVCRDTINTIINLVGLPVIFFGLVFTPRVKQMGWLNTMMACLFLRWIVLLAVLVLFPTSTPALIYVYFLLKLLQTFRFILSIMYVNAIPRMSLSAIFITMFESGINLGKLDAVHVLLAEAWGWRTCAIVGLVLEAVLIVLFPLMFSFAQKGTSTVDGIIQGTKLGEITMEKELKQQTSKQTQQKQGEENDTI